MAGRQRPWLIAAFVFAIAGGYEFLPAKKRWLDICRQPGLHVAAGDTAVRVGFDHGLACLGSSWALMLLMFGAGVASLPRMLLLTGVMVFKRWVVEESRLSCWPGVTFLALAFLLLTDPGEMPAWLLV